MNLNSAILETLVRARTEQLIREAQHARLVKAAEVVSPERKSIMMLVRQFLASAPTPSEAPQLATQAGC